MSEENGHSGYGELIFVGSIGLVFLIEFGLSLSYPSDPRLFPLLIAVVGMLLAVATQVGLRGRKKSLRPESVAAKKLIWILVVPPVYGLALWALGFWIATIVTIPVLSVMLGYRRYALIAMVTLVMALAVGLLFPVVHIAVPKSALFGRTLPF
jgi:hypothetical protein